MDAGSDVGIWMLDFNFQFPRQRTSPSSGGHSPASKPASMHYVPPSKLDIWVFAIAMDSVVNVHVMRSIDD